MRLFQNLSSLQLSLPFAASLFLFVGGYDASPQGSEVPQGQEPTTQDEDEADAASVDARWILKPTTSKRAVEETIAGYLSEVHDYDSELRESRDNPEDLWLSVSSSANDLPGVDMHVNAIALNGDENEVSWMRIQLSSWFSTGVGKDHPKRLRVLEVINDYNQSVWGVTRAYLDSDGDVALDSNVMLAEIEHGVHCEVVWDHLVDIVDTWKGLGAALRDAGCPYGN